MDISYDRQFAQHWQLLARLAYDWYYYHGVYVMDYAGNGVPPYSLNEDYSQGRWWTAQAEISRTFLEKHHITIGSEERFNTQQDQWNYDLPSHESHLNDHRSSIVAAVYAQDQYKILRNLILSAGLRYDHYDTFGGSLNPRLALIYRPWERTALKLIYGQAFRAPNTFELYYTDQISEEGNPSLRPESVKTTELIYEQYFLKRAHLTLSGFYNSSHGLIDLATTPADNLLQFQNSQNVIGKGIEFEVGGEWANGWKLRLADTIQESYDPQNRANQFASPRQLPKISLIAPLPWRKLFIGTEAQYVTRMLTTDGSDLGGFLIANATLSTPEFLKGLSASFSVYNLFDKRYAYPPSIGDVQAGIPQDSRGLRVKLTYRFPKWPGH